ncbi:hypothetical protein WR25_06631 [Diploscapter pachys]|uniref:MADF domain-containing protein n=1 Tax=Diploscapter pachys TaxID=2018661 RepID=A0A2A2L158_9BILA|nr:hypothetical protein WR25_06631 [Diploscapter pachys]
MSKEELDVLTDDATEETSFVGETTSSKISPSGFTSDEKFEMALMEKVKKNECLYNRAHPHHKMTDYKLSVWNQIAKELNVVGATGVEVERKWRHMRDRYVRIKKASHSGKTLKNTDKWYYYVKKMDFLDPYIEHRRRRRKSFASDGSDHGGSEYGEEIVPERTVDPMLTDFYESFIKNACKSTPERVNINVTIGGETAESTEVTHDKKEAVTLLDTLMTDDSRAPPALPSPSPSQLPVESPAAKRVRAIEPSMERGRGRDTATTGENSEVTHFVRSIEKSLAAMDQRTFAWARFEISRVIFQCQFGAEVAKNSVINHHI